ncbi:TetR family transcriptional regulator [Nitrospirillum viridazoti Y2]|uniref:TetR/AcrR family transcriptional regulator C-terminal domain-containing protein n=1 Tax=Nitrospirillum viridazoti TaxID=3144925 RepID=UPI00022657D7|nr:TetR/AcrR family transcriptional regulator C-terminal domain-containing protein [Nitrospirillum amazonense]EGY00018.1 TetR family transcriptional regulator [Nitrospirillum amazonense Y2]
MAARLATGSGAIYWHVADKGELLAAATDTIITQALAGVSVDLDPRQGIRALALRLFDAIDAHPWVGAQVSRGPWPPAMLRIFEGIGGRLMALGVPEAAWFDAWSALVNYIFGVAGQNAANARLHAPDPDRSAALAAIAARWAQLDSAEYPFLRRLAAPLRDHDDRDQFLAGLDLILAGIGTVR